MSLQRNEIVVKHETADFFQHISDGKQVWAFKYRKFQSLEERYPTVSQVYPDTDTQGNKPRKKIKILSAHQYDEIRNFINHFTGLAIDCEFELERHLCLDVEQLTIKSILQTELGSRLRSQHWRYEAKAATYLKMFSEHSAVCNDNTLLLKISTLEGMSPVMLCRCVLQEKYKFQVKSQITRLMKWPHLIDDARLAANVNQCLMSDNQDGPLADIKRRVLGEEYEFKLKVLAKAAGMHYYDEHDLRRLGFDKTPDLKLILPCLYKGEVVNWIESKAIFGDVKTHTWYVHQQLASYCNRFGPGIVIYWFGYHEEIPRLILNCNGIIVLADFPDSKDLTFLDLASNEAKEKFDGMHDLLQEIQYSKPPQTELLSN